MRRVLVLLLLVAGACIAFGQGRVLRIGDKIQISCSQEPSLCVYRVLDFQGEIRLPGLGSLSFLGLRADEAARLIADRERLLPADVEVTLVPARYVPVTIEGAVRNVGQSALTPNMRLADAVRLADPTVAADLDAIEIESDSGDLLTVAFDPNPLHPEGNPYLHSGDRVIFPLATQASQITVLGGVEKPGPIPFVHGMSLKAAIDAVGGISNHGNGKDVRILRGGTDIARLDAAASSGYELHRGETVVVAMSDIRSYVTVVGEVKNGGLMPWKQGMTLAEAIKAAGGGTDQADLEGLNVQRMLGEDRFRKRMALSKDKDFVLNANDVILVSVRGRRPAAPRPEPGPHRVVPPQ